MIQNVLEEGETVAWSAPMRFVKEGTGYDDLWVKDTIYFTDRRMIWNVGKKGLFSKNITCDDLPYRAIGAIDKEQSPRSGGFAGIKAMIKGGGTVFIRSAVGSKQFQFDDEELLSKAEKHLRNILIGE